jgi:beta-glucosidase
VTLPLRIADLGMWSTEKKAFVVEPGTYELMVGASAEDIRLRARIDIR